MRITVEIDEDILRSVQSVTGLHKKSPAVNRALTDYLQEAKKKALIQRVLEGRTDYGTTNEELERQSGYDAD
jgi:Arc/MetJ family transcription regulator